MKTSTLRTLIVSTSNFDQTNTFNLSVGYTTKTVSLMCGYDTMTDGVYWAMSAGSCLKSVYTAEDVAEQDRLASEEAIKDGDIVIINNEQYKVRVLGDYSDAAIFDKVA